MRETDRNEDAMLQSLDVEEEARSQRMQVPPGSWKRQGNNSPLTEGCDWAPPTGCPTGLTSSHGEMSEQESAAQRRAVTCPGSHSLRGPVYVEHFALEAEVMRE